MTNGDVIKRAFPNAEIKYGIYGIEGIPLVCLCQHINIKTYEAFFVEEWWNTPYKEERSDKGMTRFRMFTDEELDMMEEAFCNEGLKYLVSEVRKERSARMFVEPKESE